MKIRLKIVVEGEFEDELSEMAWPDCKTAEDAAAMQQRIYYEGQCCLADLLEVCEKVDLKVTAVNPTKPHRERLVT